MSTDTKRKLLTGLCPHLHCTSTFSYTQDMLTLNQASTITKAFVKWTIGIIGAILLILILFRIGKMVKETISPTPPAPPTVAFGKLPKIQFPPKKIEGQFSFRIDTLTGTLPSFSDRAKVFKMMPDRPDLLAVQRAKEKATKVGFKTNGTQVGENVYEWVDNTPLARKLVLNTLTSNFTLTSSFLTDPTIVAALNFPDQDKAVSLVQSFLSSMSSLPIDLDSQKTKTTLFSIKNGSLVASTSYSETQILRVDLFQKNIEKMPIYYSDPTISNISFLVGGGENGPQIVQANYTYQAITEENATYPIKTAKEAYSELEKGKAYIASHSKSGSISITNVFLAYYIGKERQDYLLPIVVFEGSNNFIAYVSAVKDEWVSM